MKYDPNRHHRKSIRLQGYDYSSPGAYFITMCTHQRAMLFGNVVDGVMVLNDAGEMVVKWINELENKFPNAKIDQYVCMPNHVHFILIITQTPVGADLRVCPDKRNYAPPRGGHTGPPLHQIVQWLKTMTTNEYIRNVKHNGWPSFYGKLWQRNYHDHIIRNERALYAIRNYIINNPLKWDCDRYYENDK
ncbi:MAG: transposase [Calditrichia bacterium]